jgi:Fe-S oxidoreductase
VKVLEAGGYRVELAGLSCCGRPAISKGLLTLGRSLARENVERLVDHARKGTPILGCEPSCLLTLVDEYRDFRLGPDADLVASVAKLVDAFVADRSAMPDLPLKAGSEKVLLHGHCQQKALVGTAGTVAALGRIEGLEVKELDSGCCGMAGSFGYELGHYDVSTALAQRVLLPAARLEPTSRLVAPGFSCRSQVHGLAGIDALHPIEVIAGRLEPALIRTPRSAPGAIHPG